MLVQGKVAYFKDLTGKLRVIARLKGTEMRTWYKPKPILSFGSCLVLPLSISGHMVCYISLLGGFSVS